MLRSSSRQSPKRPMSCRDGDRPRPCGSKTRLHTSCELQCPANFFCEKLDLEVTSAFEQALTVLRTMSDFTEMNLEFPTAPTFKKARFNANNCHFLSNA